MNNRNEIAALKSLIREPYAWPGGYPRYGVLADGESICHACAKTEYKLILDATRTDSRCGWKYGATDINYEDTQCFCCNCGNQIHSAYGEENE